VLDVSRMRKNMWKHRILSKLSELQLMLQNEKHEAKNDKLTQKILSKLSELQLMLQNDKLEMMNKLKQILMILF
jgi:hypothetical protein